MAARTPRPRTVHMLSRDSLTVRPLDAADLTAVRRVLDASDYIHYRFGPDELPRLLGRFPAVGAFGAGQSGLTRITLGSLRAFLLVNWLVPPSAWIGAFGVTSLEGLRLPQYLDPLLPPLRAQPL